jgi:hypothetical protein
MTKNRGAIKTNRAAVGRVLRWRARGVRSQVRDRGIISLTIVGMKDYIRQ